MVLRSNVRIFASYVVKDDDPLHSRMEYNSKFIYDIN
jgi:hypothetical protein